ncbi:MAG: hypothetical protein NC318_03615 [Blautia sp.]|nr:hypothetical protein [Lachnoclostridium sp.]MCM1210671.1 hypothetical protein [Blautia sp.]
MGKDNVFLYDIDVPEVVLKKMDAAFLTIKEEGEHTMKRERNNSKKSIYAIAAACVVLMLLSSIMVKMMKNEDSLVAGEMVDSEDFSVTENTFTLKVMSSELEKNQPVQMISDGSVLPQKYAGSWVVEEIEEGGVAFCINVPFTCQGNGIESVTYSINQGAFQIVQPKGSSIIIDGQPYDGELNTGIIGGDDNLDTEEEASRTFETALYQSFTLDYQKQAAEDTWINICNVCPDNGELKTLIFQNTLENTNTGYQKMLNHTVITCTVNYADGTSKSEDVLVGSCIMTCAEAGAEGKEDPDREELFITFELQ